MKPGTLVIPAACLAVFVLLGRAGDQVPADGQAPKPPADQIALLEETVSAIEKARGPDDFTLLRPLETMGTAFRNAGREAEAEACFRRSLEIFRKQGGKDVRTEVRLLDCVVVSLLGQEKNAEAEKLVLEAGRLLGNLDAPCDAEIAVLSGNLGIVQERLGKLGDAEMSLRQAVNIEEKLDGPPDRRVIPMLNLAGLLARRENFREAEYQTMQVMELLDGGGEENSLLMARCLFHLAVHLMSQECYGEALDACRKAVDLQRRLRGPDHDDIAASLGLLSSILVRQEKLAEAAASCREAMEMRRKLHGPDSPMVVQEMRELALILGRQQKHAEAKELWCEALAVCRRLPAPPADLTAKTLRGLAEELSRQGQDSVAEPHFIGSSRRCRRRRRCCRSRCRCC